MPKFCPNAEILPKWRNFAQMPKFCPNAEILPNLVTLAPNNVAFKNNQSCQKAIGRIFNSSISPKRLDRVNQQLVVDQPVVRSFKNTPVLLIYPTFDQMIIRPTHSLPSTWSLVNFIWLLSSKRFLIPELNLKFETTLIFLAM